jgi:hypothetical protein
MAKTFKPTYGQLALLDWLYERKGCRFLVTTNMGSTHGFDMYETDGRNEENDRLVLKSYDSFSGNEESHALTRRIGGSRNKIDLSPLYQEKILKSGSSLYHRGGSQSFQDFAKQFDIGETFFHYNSSYYLLTKDVGYRYWEESGKALFEQMTRKRATDRAKANRLVLVGCVAPILPQWPASLVKQLPKGVIFPIPERRGIRPQAYATVIRETDRRLYLEDIQYVREVPTYGNDPRVIQGYREPFVERQHVILDNADMNIIRKLASIDEEYQEDVTRIAVDFAERMLPLIKEMDQRFFQKDNERELIFGEAIGEFKAKSASADEDTVAAKPSRKR